MNIQTAADVQSLSASLSGNIGAVIRGKDEVIKRVLVSLLAGGHILLEDMPGTGKTTLAKALSQSISCDFARVQFTPDLLPSDLTGINYYHQKTGEFIFRKGAIFTNILLADEINRATPRTQSSLLECMEERQASVDGTTYRMDAPFLVIATQNPIEIQGTFPLPEAQLDRFLMRLSLGYPDTKNELEILSARTAKDPLAALQPVCGKEEILQAQQVVSQVTVSDAVKQYIVDLAQATRKSDRVRLGLSPRGGLALMHAGQAYAAIEGRDYLLPDDVKAIAADVICHRILLKGRQLGSAGLSPKEFVAQLLEQVPVVQR
jgi:MoxR-like ATPase